MVQQKKDKEHPEYGTSELEMRFAKNFLDKLGVEYIYQFRMASIGRYLDFYCPNENLALEIDGDYWHAYGLIYEEMNPTQKRNHRVDKEKTRWCLMNGIPLIRIWEHDINDHPESVMKMLKEKLGRAREDKEKKDKKKQAALKQEQNLQPHLQDPLNPLLRKIWSRSWKTQKTRIPTMRIPDGLYQES